MATVQIEMKEDKPLCGSGDLQYLADPQARHSGYKTYRARDEKGEILKTVTQRYRCCGESSCKPSDVEVWAAFATWAKELGHELVFHC